MATLTGELISETYDSLLKVTDNNTITGIKKRITDGFGNDIPLLLSSTDIEIDGNLILSALTDLAPATKFLSLKADNSVGFRTSSELLSDIGGASSASISGTIGTLSKFTSTGAVGNSILNEIGNAIHLTDGTSSYASFGINNPGVDNDAYIGSTINNDFLIKINNVEALRIDTALRLKIANIQNALADTDKFLVSEDGIVKYRTGAEVLADIGGASAGSYVPYTGATSDVNLGAFNITATSLIKAGGVDTQFLKADGSVDNNNYLTANDLPSTLSLYATNVPADVTDYFKLVTTIDDPDYNTIAVDVPTGAITTTNQLIASLVSPVNLINGNPGVFNVTTTGNITRLSGSGEAEFFFRIYKSDSGGVETLVGTSGNTIPVINTGYSEFFATAIWNDGIFDVTDSIVIKYYANRIAGGSNPTYQFQFGGDQPVRTIVPIPTAVIPNIFLEQLADVEGGVEANNDGIFFDSSVSLWKYKSVAEVLGYTPVSSTGTLNYIPKFSGANSLVNSTIFEDAGGVAIGVPFSEAGFLFYVNGGIKANGNSTINGDLTSNKFIVPGGTSSQFLKANGSLDTNSYALASALSGYVTLATTQTITGTKTFSVDAVVNGVNIGIGSGSGIIYNTRVGKNALLANTSGDYNSAFGYETLNANTTGSANTAIGFRSLLFNTTGDSNTSIGLQSLFYNTTGYQNTSLGLESLYGNTTGYRNIAIGYRAGMFPNSFVGLNETSTSSIYLGYETTALASGNSNEIVIGNSARGGGSNSVTLGNSSIATTNLRGKVGIGYTTNPSLYDLDVNGTGRFSGNLSVFNGDVLVRNDTGSTYRGLSIGAAITDSSEYAYIKYQPNAGELKIWGSPTSFGGRTTFWNNNIKWLDVSSTNALSFTGAATFSSSVSATQGIFTANANTYAGGSLILKALGGTNPIYLTSVGGLFALSNGSGDHLTIASTGAATFSSSVSVNNRVEINGNDSVLNLGADKGGGAIIRYNSNGNLDLIPRSGFNTTIQGGNVGIGTTTPSKKLEIVTTGEQLRLSYDGASVYTDFRNDSGGGLLINTSGSYIINYLAGTPITRINPTSLEPGTDNAYSLGVSGTRWSAVWAANGTIQTSDEREKKDIVNSDLGLDFISKLRPVSFKWKVGINKVTTEKVIDSEGNPILDEEGNEANETVIIPIEGKRTHYGLIAQEVKDALGDIDFGGFIHDSETDIMGLRYDQFVPLLIKSIQELNEKIIQLENK